MNDEFNNFNAAEDSVLREKERVVEAMRRHALREYERDDRRRVWRGIAWGVAYCVALTLVILLAHWVAVRQ